MEVADENVSLWAAKVGDYKNTRRTRAEPVGRSEPVDSYFAHLN